MELHGVFLCNLGSRKWIWVYQSHHADCIPAASYGWGAWDTLALRIRPKRCGIWIDHKGLSTANWSHLSWTKLNWTEPNWIILGGRRCQHNRKRIRLPLKKVSQPRPAQHHHHHHLHHPHPLHQRWQICHLEHLCLSSFSPWHPINLLRGQR